MRSSSTGFRCIFLSLSLATVALGGGAARSFAHPLQYGEEPGYGSSRNQAADFRHRGYQDGMLGALHDLDHRRRPDPRNCKEFRNPKVSYDGIDAYRSGFRRGYDDGLREMAGIPERGLHGPNGDLMLHGYHDGATGAVRDWDRRRPADPNNRKEYRDPAVPAEVRDAYREAYRRGYTRVASMLF